MSLIPATSIRHEYSNVRTAAAAALPVEVQDMQEHLRLTHNDENDVVENAIKEAVEEIEEAFGIALITQSWQMTMDTWPSGRQPWWDGVREAHISVIDGALAREVELPRYPLQSVTSVTTYAADNTSTALTVTDYFDIDTTSKRGRMTLKSGKTWPSALRTNKAIEIVYVAGYGASSVQVPAPIRRAVKQMASYIYENRGDGCGAGDALRKSGADAIMERYKAVVI